MGMCTDSRRASCSGKTVQKLFPIELRVRRKEMSAVPITFLEHAEHDN